MQIPSWEGWRRRSKCRGGFSRHRNGSGAGLTTIHSISRRQKTPVTVAVPSAMLPWR